VYCKPCSGEAEIIDILMAFGNAAEDKFSCREKILTKNSLDVTELVLIQEAFTRMEYWK
jgi:hypothetical protein